MSKNRAGVANEAGSVHRRGVAAYLAVYGLLGQGVSAAGFPDGGPFPVRIDFETDEPTDDIACGLSDGSAMFVSAKRVCGDDRALKATVTQWVAQALTLGENDLVVLAVAEPRGVVRHLGAALLRWQAGSSTYLADELKALDAVERLLAGHPVVIRERVLSCARVIKVDAVGAGRPEFDLVAAMLEGTMVRSGFGASAVRELSLSMHTQAGRAWRSTIEDWVDVLRAARIPVFLDGGGPLGAVVAERQTAVEEHRARLAESYGRLAFSLLADDVPPLHVGSLAADLHVVAMADDGQRYEKPLLAVARRWLRMLLIGLPGSGKTVALQQLAASWARNSIAPVPVPVSLRTVAQRCTQPSDLTLSLLCEIAAREAPQERRAALAAALEDSCRKGAAVLLLDGLDECLSRRALVADGLLTLLDTLPPDTGMILATRSSGELAARRLRLPTVHLVRPRNLDTVLQRLLEHIAELRVPERDRHAWIVGRTGWLDDARDEYGTMSEVPLLATLLVLVAASSTDSQLPASRANLLMTAVKDSVRRWERQRSEDRSNWPTDGQLLDGYAAIGQRLADAGELASREAAAKVSDMLANRWGLAPGPAAEIAEKILWFWDEHVGVFVRTNATVIVSRSRVFSEIASAMWVCSLPDQRVSEWVRQSLRDPDREESLQLAAELHPAVIEALLAEDDLATMRRSALIAARAVENGAILSLDQMKMLVGRLQAGAKQEPTHGETDSNQSDLFEPRNDRDKPGGICWACARKLASLPMPAELRDTRSGLLANLQLGAHQRTIAAALRVLSDAAASGQPPSGSDEKAVSAALNLPIPRRNNPRSENGVIRFRSGPSLMPGHVEVAIGAARHLQNLDERIARRVQQIGDRSSFLIYPQVSRALADRGYRFTPKWGKGLRNVTQSLAFWNNHPEMRLLEAAEQVSDVKVELSAADAWRLPDLCNLFSALNISQVGAIDLSSAVTSDTSKTRNEWIKCAALAAGLNVAAIATQAQLAVREASVNPDPDPHHLLELLLTGPAGEMHELDPERLSDRERATLINLLSARSDWIANTACQMLRQAREGQLHKDLLIALPDLPARRRSSVAYLAGYTSMNPVHTAAGLLGQTDPMTRAGAARLLAHIQNPGSQAQALLAHASHDQDLTIRVASGQPSTEPGATIWSCPLCAYYNDIANNKCGNCHLLTHPSADNEN